MFRRLPNRLPQDVTFPADLKSLGYFVTENDQIRKIDDPEKKYQFRINRNDRINDVYKEAMNACSRAIVLQRLRDLGLQELPLPLGATKQDKHIPILISPDLADHKHVLVIFPERHTDLGILSYRILGDEGINAGSLINLVKTILHGPAPLAGRPGLIIANPSQLIWYRGGHRAVTDREWLNLPRPSAVHSAMRIDDIKNRVEGNRNFEEHIEYIFGNILFPSATYPTHSPICHPQAKFSIVGLEYPGSYAVQLITSKWPLYSPRISAVALCNPQHTLNELFSTDPDSPHHKTITNFIATRTRAYRVSRKPLETPLESANSDGNGLGCNVYSSGEAMYEESVFARCWGSVIDWIDICRFSEGYKEQVLTVSKDDEVQSERDWKWPTTEEEIGEARFHGEVTFGEENVDVVGNGLNGVVLENDSKSDLNGSKVE